MERKVRVRFAPSPTGPLHIGGVRTALFNYLYARRMGGEMVLRIEDTDSKRFVPGAEDYICEALDWLGIHFDEGVKQGGPHGPYRQSERRDIYRRYVKQLLDDGKAYIAFDTPEELEQPARPRPISSTMPPRVSTCATPSLSRRGDTASRRCRRNLRGALQNRTRPRCGGQRPVARQGGNQLQYP